MKCVCTPVHLNDENCILRQYVEGNVSVAEYLQLLTGRVTRFTFYRAKCGKYILISLQGTCFLVYTAFNWPVAVMKFHSLTVP
jgi:hypothetical protein